MVRLLWIALVLLLHGCASTRTTATADPAEPVNRAVFAFNRTADRVLLRPIARGYRAVLPDPAERGVSNFFDNLTTPVSIVNNALQGKGQTAGTETLRLLINTTAGVGGLFDVANEAGLPSRREDFGQTFARWGFGPGPYLMLPFLGPATLRDGIGTLGDAALHPLAHYENTSIRDKLIALEAIEARAGLLGVDQTLDEAIDPYLFLRDAYLQRRDFLIFDGDPPEDLDADYEDFSEEEFSEEDFLGE